MCNVCCFCWLYHIIDYNYFNKAFTFLLVMTNAQSCRKSCDYIIRPIFTRLEYDCLVDRKGRAAYLSSLVTVANQETLYDFLSFVQVNLESVVIELGTCEAEYIRSKFYRE